MTSPLTAASRSMKLSPCSRRTSATAGLDEAEIARRLADPVVARVASLKFSYDERVEDGLYAARAVQYLCALLEDPAST